jgi:hypothetical protein
VSKLVVKQYSPRERVALALVDLTYTEMRELARELSQMTVERADPKAGLGGFDIASTIDWAEALADWAESVF